LATGNRSFLNGLLGLPFASDEKHLSFLSCNIRQKIGRHLQLFYGFGKVNDVDRIPLLEDERLHLWIPSLRLVSKMNSRLQEFRH